VPDPTVAAVDGGKSALRLTVVGPAGRHTATVPGFGYQVGGGDEIDQMARAVSAALDKAGHSGPVDRLCAGLTGLPGAADQRRRLRDRLAELLCGAEILLAGDTVPAHAGALRGPGVVVNAGTGTTVLALGEDGRHAVVDGWGPHLGDRGSGYAIGRAGLHAALAALDGAAHDTVLVTAVPVLFGGRPDLDRVQRLYRDPEATARIAGFATAVAAAVRDGDPVATGIWRTAVADLAASATAAAERLGLRTATVSWSGRLFAAGPILTDPLSTALAAAGHRLVPPRGDALSGALWLAGTRSDPRYQPLLDGGDRAGMDTDGMARHGDDPADTARHGVGRDGTVRHGIDSDGAGQDSAGRHGGDRAGTARRRTDSDGADRNSAGRHGGDWAGIARHGMGRDGADRDSAGRGGGGPSMGRGTGDGGGGEVSCG
jgi:N-acetylglucosamine kinase-like BadF-type ATPase